MFPLYPRHSLYQGVLDIGDERTLLGEGTFKWLVSIRTSHLVYRYGDDYYLEPYLPNRFIRQFSYDQLYVSNQTLGIGTWEV